MFENKQQKFVQEPKKTEHIKLVLASPIKHLKIRLDENDITLL